MQTRCNTHGLSQSLLQSSRPRTTNPTFSRTGRDGNMSSQGRAVASLPASWAFSTRTRWRVVAPGTVCVCTMYPLRNSSVKQCVLYRPWLSNPWFSVVTSESNTCSHLCLQKEGGGGEGAFVTTHIPRVQGHGQLAMGRVAE